MVLFYLKRIGKYFFDFVLRLAEILNASNPKPYDPKYHGWSSSTSNASNVNQNKKASSNTLTDRRSSETSNSSKNKPAVTSPNHFKDRRNSKSVISKIKSSQTPNQIRNPISQPNRETKKSMDLEDKHQSNNNATGTFETINNEKAATKISRIPLPLTDSTRPIHQDFESSTDHARNKGAIRKQPKPKNSKFEKKVDIPTKMKITKLDIIDHVEKPNPAGFTNVTSGDIIDDVLYISTPLKSQNIDPLKGGHTDDALSEKIDKHDNLQSFHLIAPDNFMTYTSLSVQNDKASTRPCLKEVLENSEFVSDTEVSRDAD